MSRAGGSGEIFFDPQAHTTREVEFSTVIEGLHRAQVEAEGRLGIESHLIMCFLRDLSAESAREALEQAAPYREPGRASYFLPGL